MFEKRLLMISVSLCSLFFFLTLINCGKKVVTPNANADLVNLVKNSSFEKNGDPTTVGWEGVSSCNISRGAPAVVGGGIWCMMLSGGCVWESALYLLDYVENGGIYELSCWARKEQYGTGWASISFFNKTRLEFGKSTPVISKTWSKVILVDTLSVAPGDSIYVFLEAGGGIFSSCNGFFDLVRVIKKN